MVRYRARIATDTENLNRYGTVWDYGLPKLVPYRTVPNRHRYHFGTKMTQLKNEPIQYSTYSFTKKSDA